TDKWFRPVMITDGPDGCLYICDWCDKQVSHFRNQMGVMDKEHGRVWRVRMADKARPARTLPVKEASGKLPDNRWLRQTYLRLAREDRRQTPQFNQLDDFWSHVAHGIGWHDLKYELENVNPDVRRWVVNYFGE